MPDAKDQLTADRPAATEESGKAGESSGKDPTVAGLSARLTKEIEGRKADKQALAEALSKLGTEEDGRTKLTRMERENLGLKTALKYPDIAPILQKAFDKGALNPEFVDDDFVAALRAASNGATPATKTEESDTETPAHNPIRSTSPVSAMETLKGMTWPES